MHMYVGMRGKKSTNYVTQMIFNRNFLLSIMMFKKVYLIYMKVGKANPMTLAG